MSEYLFALALVGLIAITWILVWLLTRLDLLEEGMEYDDPREDRKS
jgi:hypothetical protein